MGVFDDLPSPDELKAAAQFEDRERLKLESVLAAAFRDLADKMSGVPEDVVEARIFGDRKAGWLLGSVYWFPQSRDGGDEYFWAVLGADGSTRGVYTFTRPLRLAAAQLSQCSALQAASAVMRCDRRVARSSVVDGTQWSRLEQLAASHARHSEVVTLALEAMRDWYIERGYRAP